MHDGTNEPNDTTPISRHSRPSPRKSLIMQTPVLVLNASYEPINICAARRAIVLVLKGLANAGRGEWTFSPCCAAGHACAFGDPVAGVPAYSAPDPRIVAQEHPFA